MLTNPSDTSHQAGLSLIEMMVSMVLGLFLLGSMSSVYMGNKGADKIRQEITKMEADARFALSNLQQGIQHAGYQSIYIIPFESGFLTPSDAKPEDENTTCRDNTDLLLSTSTHPASVDGSESLSDTITSIQLADNPDDNKNPTSRARVFTDCVGNTISEACSADPENGMNNPADAKIYNSYYVTNNTLMCLGSREAGGAAVKLAENIENMQIRYGVNINGQTSFRNATDIQNNNEWQSVTSVQVAMLISSERNVLDKDDAGPYQLLDKSIPVADSKKRRLHRVFTATVNLPNRLN